MKKVLIIDDEKRTRDLIAKMIETFGFDLTVISEGETMDTAIQAIQNHQPDILFIDIQMPDGTGFDVLKQVEDKSFEVIFITAHEEFAIQAIKFSALDYLLKPVDPLELKEAVEKNPGSIIITERSLYTDKYVFAKMLFDSGKIEDVNYKIYNKWFDEFISDLPEHKFFFIKSDPTKSKERINKRKRVGEDNISIDYLSSCEKYHLEMYN
jgi:YesN/AraC family two-component response regulator